MSEESKRPTLETDTSMLKETLEGLKQEESKKHELSHPASTSLLPDQFFLELFSRAGSSQQPSQQEDGKKHELSHPASTSFLEYPCNTPSSFPIGSTLSNKEMSGVILPMDLVKKKDRMLPDHALLLKTLEELTEEQMETFQSYLTSPQQSKYPPIPRSQLKNTDRLNTVDQMVQYWGLLRAVRTTVRILKEINKHDLAVKLERDHTAFYRDFKNQANRHQPLTRALHHKRFSEFSPAGSSHQPSPWVQCLHVPALLLKTLEELTEEQMETFQYFLTSPQRSDCPPISKCKLEEADTWLTVDQMVGRYGHDRAVEVTVKILRKMDQNELAKKLDCAKLTDSSSVVLCKETLDEDDTGIHKFTEEMVTVSKRGVEGKNRKQSNLMAPRGLLTTLEELSEEQMQTFQSILTSPLWYNYPPIPRSLVKNTDRQNTVYEMVGRYGPQRAVEITVKILRTIKQHDLAKKLERGKKRIRSKAQSWPGPSGVKKREEHRISLTDSSSGTLSDESSDRGDTEIQQDRDELDTNSNSSLVKISSQEDIQEQEATSDAPAVDVQESGLSLDKKDQMEGSAIETHLEMFNSLNTDMTDNNPPENSHGMDEDLETDSPVLEHPDMKSTDEFTPEIHNQENGGEYRFQCPCEGLFQCSITGLVFGMEGEGEVVYRTVPWDRRLLTQSGKRPAGPLFNIYCPQKSVSQLHLPHCEILSEGGCDFLFVAHEADGNIEFIHPHQKTETHLILNITGFSKYGVTKDTNAPITPIRAVVLLFYQIPDVNNKSMLNVLLLPRNVDIDEVCEKRRRRNEDREKYIEINPNCLLTPDEDYTLSTDLSDEQHHIEPAEKATFVDYDSYTNYMPTFQLWLEAVLKKVNLILKEHDGPEIWKRSVPLPAPPINVPSTVTQPADITAGTTRDVSFHLLATLMELKAKNVKIFKWFLTKGVDGFPAIPKGQMEDCNKPDTVDRMVETYCDDAVKVTLAILRRMNLNNLAETLQQKVLNTS